MKLTLNSLFNYIEDDGIFSYLNTYSVPWKNTVDVDILNLDYHTKMGSRVISKTIVPLLDEDGLSTANKQKLAKLIYNKNKVKWDELWSSLSLYDRFDPLNNTDWSETERFEHRGTDSKTQNLGAKTNSYTKGQQANTSQTGAQTFTEGSHTDTIGSQSNTTGTHTDTHEEKKSAYNSSSYQPNDKTEDVYGQISETLGQRQDSYGSKENSQSARSDSFTEGQRIDSSTEGAQQNTESGSNSYTDIHTIERAGNIGVTTSGQLIDDFRRVVDWQFFDHVYDDINEILVLSIYGDEDETIDDYTIITPYLPIASAIKLGGIKVGHNLTIESDGTLNAIAESGDVVSVNGKTGIVVLVPSDIGAASSTDLSTLSGIVSGQGEIITAQGQAINNIRQVPSGGSTGQAVRKTADGYAWGNVAEVPDGGNVNDVLQRVASGYMWAGILQVPSGGNEGQVLTKGAGNTYSWQDVSGGGGGPIYLDYTLVAGGLTDYNGLCNWNSIGGNANERCYCYDVSQYAGKLLECYFVAVNPLEKIDMHKFGFLPDMDLTQYAQQIAGSYYGGGHNAEKNIYGPNILPLTNQTENYNQHSIFTYCTNHYMGVVPPSIKYFIVQTALNPSSVDWYNNNVKIVCKIFDE